MPRSEQPSTESSHLTLTREGEYWTILYEGRVLRLRHSKGLAYIAHLLSFPKEEFHVSDLQIAVTAATTNEPHVTAAINGTKPEENRESAEAVERLRKAVGNRIRASLRKIEQNDPALSRYLANAIRTGAYCSYAPRSRASFVGGEEKSKPERT